MVAFVGLKFDPLLIKLTHDHRRHYQHEVQFTMDKYDLSAKH